jgi:hypothetical protein
LNGNTIHWIGPDTTPKENGGKSFFGLKTKKTV